MTTAEVSVASSLEEDTLHCIVELFERVQEPLSANQIQQQLTHQLQRPVLDKLLAEAVASGRLFSHGKYGNAEQFFHQPVEDFALTLICRKLADGPLTQSDLRQKVKARLARLSLKRIDELRKELVRERRVYELPATVGRRAKLYSVRKADPRDYIEDAVAKITDKLKRHGVSEDEVWDAVARLTTPTSAPPGSDEAVDLPRRILDRMKLVDPRADDGKMVSIAELRRLNDFQHEDRAAFDQALWQLVKSKKLAVHPHGSIGLLTEAERAEHLLDSSGRYYHAVSRRIDG